jgi:hypothetical protein
MKRIRERKGAGYQFDPDSKVRPVDNWRQWAAVPLPRLKVSSSVRPPGRGPYDPTYTLEEDGVVIGTWRKSDAPWLRGWLSKRLGQLNGAWHLAQENLKVHGVKVRAGENTALTRKSDAAIRDKRIAKAAKAILAVDGPMGNTELADRVVERVGGGPKAVRKKLPKVRKPG